MCRPLVLPVLLAVLFGSIHFLPKAGATAQSAIRMDLPSHEGDWQLQKIPPSEAETNILSKDTEFAKARCFRVRPDEFDKEGRPLADMMDLSIVLSGSDLNNSIHRPERCMPAQGHQILSSSDIQLRLRNGRTITVRRLLSRQTIPISEDHKQSVTFNSLTCYVFIGHERITNDHTYRTIIDMKDRLLHGMDQRWAYLTVSTWYGKLPWLPKEITEEEADKKIRQFFGELAETSINWDQVKR
jgi:hypothetical protein